MFTFAIRKVHGSAVPTRTPTACGDSIFRKEPTCRCTRKPISTKWPASSMSGHARPWDLKPRQRNLTPVLRRPVEPATPKADIDRRGEHVRLVPGGDLSRCSKVREQSW